MNYSIQVWWRRDDGRTYAETMTFGHLGEAQRAVTNWERSMAGWPDYVTACGISKVVCPPEGPFPRPGEAGKLGLVVRAPERDPEEIFAAHFGKKVRA